jgi:hypothetical protein
MDQVVRIAAALKLRGPHRAGQVARFAGEEMGARQVRRVGCAVEGEGLRLVFVGRNDVKRVAFGVSRNRRGASLRCFLGQCACRWRSL